MTDKSFDVIIVGGSYSGLSAAMALGRSLRRVLVIDSGKPCNRQTPHSHNFITHDGRPPAEIAALAREQVKKYDTVKFVDGLATSGSRTENGFKIQTSTGETFEARKLIFATGIRDIMPDIKGFAECWGITVLHCPYCHGYEVRNQKTGILGNGDVGFEFSIMISNWTKDLTLFTNGKPTLTAEQTSIITKQNIKVVDTGIDSLEHDNGQLRNIVFKNGTRFPLPVLYGRRPFEQHCNIPEVLGCELTEAGYIKVDPFNSTTVQGVFACGDNASGMRTVSNAVAMGTTAGLAINKEIIFDFIA